MMDRMFGKITGREADKKPEASGIRKKEDLAFSQTELSPGMEKKWDSKMAAQAQSVEDRQKLDDIRQKLADKEAAAAFMAAYGGGKGFAKEVLDRSLTEQANLANKEELEKREIEKRRIADLAKLEGKATRIGIDKDLELWEQREAEDKNRRERLDLE
ncbi:MAG: hypothetical protein ACYC44_04950 [Patescibacteria group bacterium]